MYRVKLRLAFVTVLLPASALMLLVSHAALVPRPIAMAHCKAITLPGLDSSSRVFFMDAITQADGSVTLIALAGRFFNTTRMQKSRDNSARALTFDPLALVGAHDVYVAASTSSDSRLGACKPIATSTSDASTDGLLHLTHCRPPLFASGSDARRTMVLVAADGHTCVSIAFPSSRSPAAGLFRHVAPLAPSSGSQPRLVLCIGGITDYVRHAKEILSYYRSMNVAHVYLGLNLAPNAPVARRLRADLANLTAFVSVVPNLAAKHVAFTQGKLAFYNSCVHHVRASTGGDVRVGVLDLDEVLVTHRDFWGDLPRAFAGSTACAHVLASGVAVGEDDAFVEHGSLLERFPSRSTGGARCGNYSKTVSEARLVDFVR